MSKNIDKKIIVTNWNMGTVTEKKRNSPEFLAKKAPLTHNQKARERGKDEESNNSFHRIYYIYLVTYN